ncbi:acetyltransferase [Tetragenococcus halophilus subsp. flandriensis]|uniref:GNAT family N-acetyltransferase n=1 Tax=Tetragenococcus halophilus TaxID=51669 RepID=UPI0023E95044|nr:GNAT family N-acetyltransferase [Tetragenococcus halophilus]GMA07334.1 acetyltransferase [Tetragenococcus halophilus subsp. flandriensis]
MWKIKKLEELTNIELLEIFRLRVDTFMIEQERIYHEVDDNDKIAYHIFFQNQDDKRITCYARVFPINTHVTFGRVVISKELRGQGHGDVLMENVLKVCRERFSHKIIEIEAQEQVVPFYIKFGFKVVGDTFIFEGTPHQEMRLE